MAKTKIRGTFATGADAAAVHHISTARRHWLDRETVKAVDEAVVFFVPLAALIDPRKTPGRKKRAPTERSPRVARVAAKKK